jgi:hypothetical protein
VNTSRRFAETNPPVACSQATPVATARKSRAVVVLVDIHFSLLPTHRFSHPNCSGKFMYVGMDPKSCLFPARPMQDGFMRLEPARARLCSHTDGAGSHITATLTPRRIARELQIVSPFIILASSAVRDLESSIPPVTLRLAIVGQKYTMTP